MARRFARPPALAGEIEESLLDNGLTVCLARNRQAPLVSAALFYRAGCRDEEPGLGGLAHFLEHMMFKGSPAYGPGEIDRLTQRLGGSNNAFTSHDVTAYYFTFAADRWPVALAIEADRMCALTLDPEEVASERQVILEEIAMYRDDPWDALELATLAALWGDHPYGRPILGTEEALERAGREELASFHARCYRPDRAVLVLAGDLDASALERARDAFAAIPRGVEERAPLARPIVPAAERRVERQHGEVARMLLALPAPPPDAPGHAELRVLAATLALGRSSRLQRELVEEGELCLSVAVGVGEGAAASTFTIAAELLPGVDPGEVERRMRAALAELGERPLGDEELDRVRHVVQADWVYGHERIHQQALAVGAALAEFDLGQPERLLARALDAGPGALVETARRWLVPGRGGVFGVSFPESRA